MDGMGIITAVISALGGSGLSAAYFKYRRDTVKDLHDLTLKTLMESQEEQKRWRHELADKIKEQSILIEKLEKENDQFRFELERLRKKNEELRGKNQRLEQRVKELEDELKRYHDDREALLNGKGD